MSSPKAPSAGESTAQSLDAVIRYLPAYQEILNKGVLPQAKSEFEAAQAISPQYQQLLSEMYRQFGPDLAQTGAEVDRIGRVEGAKTDAQILDTSGRDLARSYESINREINPEYYDVRAQTGQSLGQLLRGVNLDDPSVEAERLINQENIRSGTDAAPSATTTVGNAINFGNERLKRMSALSSAVAQANSFLPAANNAQFNPATTALNRPTSNTGQNQFAGVQSGAGSGAYGVGQGLFNNVAGFQNNAAQINANRRDVLDRLNETTSSV